MPSPTPLTYAAPTVRPSPYRPFAYLITYVPQVLLCFVAILIAAVSLSPLGRIGPIDAINLRAPWVEREATFGPWISDPPSSDGTPTHGSHRQGTIDIQFSTFAFVDYAEGDADVMYRKPLFTRITNVKTHYLKLIPAVLAWILILFGVAWGWQRICRVLFSRWLNQPSLHSTEPSQASPE